MSRTETGASRGWAIPIGLALLAAATALTPVALPQAETVDWRRLQRENERLREEVGTLLKRLEHIEGSLRSAYPKQAERVHSALERARKPFALAGDDQARTLLEHLAQTQAYLRGRQAGLLRREQDAIIAEMRTILRLLEGDREQRDLEKEIEQLEKELAALDELQARQRELRSKTAESSAASRSEGERSLAADLEKLESDQRDLLRRTEKRIDPREQLLREQLDDLLKLIARQEKLVQHVDRSATSGNLPARIEKLQTHSDRARKGLDLAQRLEELARAAERNAQAAERNAKSVPAGESLPEAAGAERERERAEAERIERKLWALENELSGSVGSDQEKERAEQRGVRAAARAARAAQEALAERKSTPPLQAAGKAREAAEQVRKAADEAERQAAEELRASAAAIEKLLSQVNLEEKPREALSEASRSSAQALEVLSESGDLERAQDSFDEAQQALERGRSALPTSGDLAREEYQLTKRAEREANQMRAEQQEEGAKALDEASEKMAGATSALGAEEPSQALDPARAALEDLRRAQAGLEKQIGELGSQHKSDPSASKAAAEQRSLEQSAGQIGSKIGESTRSGELNSEQGKSSGDALKHAAGAMREAGAALEQGQPSTASSKQREALEALGEARQALRREHRLKEPQKAEAAELSQREKELRDEILRLEQAMEKHRPEGDTSKMSKAAGRAQSATEELGDEQLDQAQKSQQDVEKLLAAQKEELERKKREYLSQRNEEILIQLSRELDEHIAVHREVMSKTLALQEKLERNPRSRVQKRLLDKEGRRERGIAEKLEEAHTILVEQKATVYGYYVEACQDDLRRIAERMAPRGGSHAGLLTQDLQEDVLQRLVWLRNALEEQAREQQQSSGKNQQGQPGKNRLVPDIAELQLLKLLEEDVRKRTRAFLEQSSAEQAFSPTDLREIRRLGNRHNRINRLYKGFKERLGIPDQARPDKVATEEANKDEKDG